jgi:hypothetical protein
MPIITARFLWVFPSVLSQFLTDLYIITALATATIVLVSKGIQRRTQSRYSRRYYIHGNKKRSSERRHDPQDVIFDSDSFLIQIDSGASRSISNDKSHFESIEPLDTNDPAGILGPTGDKSPAFKTCLLCTQHWSQSANDHFPTRNGTWQASYSDHIVLYWDQHRFTRTVPWDASTKTGYLRSAAGAIDYRVFRTPTDSRPDRYNSKTVTHSKGPKMCWLYVRSNDQATQKEIWSHHHFCRSCKSSQLHTLPTANFL